MTIGQYGHHLLPLRTYLPWTAEIDFVIKRPCMWFNTYVEFSWNCFLNMTMKRGLPQGCLENISFLSDDQQLLPAALKIKIFFAPPKFYPSSYISLLKNPYILHNIGCQYVFHRRTFWAELFLAHDGWEMCCLVSAVWLLPEGNVQTAKREMFTNSPHFVQPCKFHLADSFKFLKLLNCFPKMLHRAIQRTAITVSLLL